MKMSSGSWCESVISLIYSLGWDLLLSAVIHIFWRKRQGGLGLVIGKNSDDISKVNDGFREARCLLLPHQKAPTFSSTKANDEVITRYFVGLQLRDPRVGLIYVFSISLGYLRSRVVRFVYSNHLFHGFA